VNDTSRFEAGFKATLPMTSMQVNAVRYVGIIRNGEPVIVGRIQ
jgi:hypothetical protein